MNKIYAQIHKIFKNNWMADFGHNNDLENMLVSIFVYAAK